MSISINWPELFFLQKDLTTQHSFQKCMRKKTLLYKQWTLMEMADLGHGLTLMEFNIPYPKS